jgi:hypothetical protein
MTIRLMRYEPTDPRLGRHVRHDSRSARPQYAIGVLPRAAIKSVEWPRHIPILNQGQVGSCVPNNIPEFLGTDAAGYTGVTGVTVPKTDTQGEFLGGSVWTLDEIFAQQAYRLLTRIDSYPGQWEPDDTGSDGLTLAQAMVMLGFSDVYQHAFSYDAAVSGLQSAPVTLGLEWENSMFTTRPDGKIIIDYSSGVAGGHQIFARKFDADNDRVWIDNSWGADGFGLDGRGWFQGNELAEHLKRNGDVTQPHLIYGAAPKPKPPITGQQLFDKIKSVAKAGGLK